MYREIGTWSLLLRRPTMTTRIIQAIIEIVDKKIRHLSYDKTFPSVVYEKDDKGKHKIAYEGRLRSVSNALPIEIDIGTLVWVKIPNGNLKNMHICGVRK